MNNIFTKQLISYEDFALDWNLPNPLIDKNGYGQAAALLNRLGCRFQKIAGEGWLILSPPQKQSNYFLEQIKILFYKKGIIKEGRGRLPNIPFLAAAVHKTFQNGDFLYMPYDYIREKIREDYPFITIPVRQTVAKYFQNIQHQLDFVRPSFVSKRWYLTYWETSAHLKRILQVIEDEKVYQYLDLCLREAKETPQEYFNYTTEISEEWIEIAETALRGYFRFYPLTTGVSTLNKKEKENEKLFILCSEYLIYKTLE